MITKEKEYESKVLISRESFKKLIKLKKLKVTNNQLIVNNYFDTKNFHVFEQNGVFRVRETQDKMIATFKQALKKNEFQEYHKKITTTEFRQLKNKKCLKGKFIDLLKSNNIEVEQLELLGFLVTHRWSIQYKESTIFIDHCVYNNNEDWEIECESKTAKMAEKRLVSFCKENSINFSGKAMSKYARFLFSMRKGC